MHAIITFTVYLFIQTVYIYRYNTGTEMFPGKTIIYMATIVKGSPGKMALCPGEMLNSSNEAVIHLGDQSFI